MTSTQYDPTLAAHIHYRVHTACTIELNNDTKVCNVVSGA